MNRSGTFLLVLALGLGRGAMRAQEPTPTPTAVPAPEPTPAAPEAPPPEPEPVAPPITAAGASSNPTYFNPAMAVIGNFLATAGRNPVEERPSLEMHESEISLQAIVDPYARADFFVAISNEGVELEEGFITFTHLPADFLVKVGKFKAQFGKVNTLHAHVLPWADVPLPLVNLARRRGGMERLRRLRRPALPPARRHVLGADSPGLSRRIREPVRGAFEERPGVPRAVPGVSRHRRRPQRRAGRHVGTRPQRSHGRRPRRRWRTSTSSTGGSRFRGARTGRSSCGASSCGAAASSPAASSPSRGFFVGGDYQLARRWFGRRPLRVLRPRR